LSNHGKIGEMPDALPARDALLRMLYAALDMSILLETIFEIATRQLPFARAVMLLTDEEEPVLRFGGSRGVAPTAVGALGSLRLSMTESPPLFAGALITGEPTFITGAQLAQSDRYRPFAQAITASFFLAIPLIAGGKVLGVLLVDNGDGGQAFRAEAVELLCGLRDHIASALRNAFRYRRSNFASQDVEEQVVVRTLEFARALRLKDEYLANMSHELRTPLTSILSMTEALRTHMFGMLTEEQTTALEIAEESGQLLLAVINNLLDLAKIEAGKMELHPEPVDLLECCQIVMRIITQSVRQKSLNVTMHIDEQVQLLYADPVRVTQMLVNLLSNAVKFTLQGGEIGLEVQGDRQAGMVSFTVWDTGIGIPPEKLPLLFQPFTQVDNRLVNQQTGTGLGLSLVNRIAELHGGSVSVNSVVGEGTRFTILLPWHEEMEEGALPTTPPVTPAVEDTGAPVATVLLVDANIRLLGQLAAQVASLGYHVGLARGGAEGIERALLIQPALILLDMQLPGMDAMQVMRCLRQHSVTADIPIIGLTALVMPGDHERYLEAGVTDSLVRPVALDQLRALLERHLSPVQPEVRA